MMKQRLQMTIVEPTMSTPAWRSASPKNRNTRPRRISPKTCAENLTMSPKLATQSFGTASHSGTGGLPGIGSRVPARGHDREALEVVIPTGAVERGQLRRKATVGQVHHGLVPVGREGDLDRRRLRRHRVRLELPAPGEGDAP